MNTESTTLLIRAASEGDYEEMCEILNLYHFDPPSINQAVHAAVCKSQSASDHLRCIESLFSHQANPNFKDANGVSLLMIAAKLGQIQLAELLTNNGSAVDDRDKDFRTPLMYAVDSEYGDNVDVVKFLLEKKAKVGIQDALGNTALHKSAEKGYINSMQILLDFGAFINSENKEKETPLHLACKHAFEACIELLIEKKANVNILNISGKTPVDLLPENLKYLFEKPQDNNSDSSFCSISSHNEVFCKVCKKGMQEGICKPCYEVNLSYSNQASVENRKIIEDYAKEIAELKTGNLELNKRLKEVSENFAQYKRNMVEKEAENRKKETESAQILKLVKETAAKLEMQTKECDEKLREAEQEIVSLTEQLSNAKSENRLYRTESEILRKRLEDSIKDSEPAKAKKGKKLTYLKPLNQNAIPSQVSIIKDEIGIFMQELEKWQEEVEPVYSELTKKIKRIIKKKFPSCEVEIYGSYATKLHLPSSDIDMVVLNLDCEKREALRTIDRLLRSQSFTLSTNFIQNAMVPVIKLKTELMSKQVQIDITINDLNHSGLKCLGIVNRLITQYSVLRPVFLILKQLLYVCNFKEPYNGGLGSYSLFLMVTSFLEKKPEIEHGNGELMVAECLNGFMGFYINQTTYLSPIIAADPVNERGVFRERDGYESYMSLVVVDPLNQMNNVAFSTNLAKLIHIFTIADYNLKRFCLCDCVFSSSPLYRMIYESKDYVGF